MNAQARTIETELMERETAPIDIGAMLQISRAEIDGQIATAKAYPRSVTAFVREARELVCMDEETAESCIYSLPRGKDGNGNKKFITGASARFAEIICHSWGNNRAGGRVVEVGKDTITAQGVFHDLEKNTQITKEVTRSIVDSYGKRYKADMVNVTGNAGISIALRNAILAGIPQALWLPIYEAARMAAVGDVTTLVARRAAALAWFAKVGVSPEAIFAKLDIEGVDDIGIEELETLVGIKTAIRRGDYTPERAFAKEPESTVKAATTASSMGEVAEGIAAKRAEKAKANGKPKQAASSQASADPAPEGAGPLAPLIDPAKLRGRIFVAESLEEIDEAAADISLLAEGDEKDEINELFLKRRSEIEAR